MSWRLAYLSLACEHLMMLFIDFQGCQSCASVCEPNVGTKSDELGVGRQRERMEGGGGQGRLKEVEGVESESNENRFCGGENGYELKKN